MSFNINAKDFIWNFSNINNVLNIFCYYTWQDNTKICYVNNHIYNKCDKCPYRCYRKMLGV